MKEYEYKIEKERVEKEYFIDPNGKIHKWKGSLKELHEWCSTHALIAHTITGIESGAAKDYLVKLNWLMVGSACGNFLQIENEPTQAQINTLFDLGYHHICTNSGERFSF